jgi:hypothetical protein
VSADKRVKRRHVIIRSIQINVINLFIISVKRKNGAPSLFVVICSRLTASRMRVCVRLVRYLDRRSSPSTLVNISIALCRAVAAYRVEITPAAARKAYRLSATSTYIMTR